MGTVTVILEILRVGLSLWESKEKRKYVDKLIRLEKEIYEEEAKPLDAKDQALIDNLHFDLMLLGRAFAQDAGQNPTNKP